MIDYATILLRRYPDAKWTLNADDYDQLTWLCDAPKPSKSELDALWGEVRAEIAAEAQAKVAARESAIAKLSALGLDAEEITALLGV